ncbi:MAG: FecR domain-containing protein, partial [Thiohalomonadales bacterium]
MSWKNIQLNFVLFLILFNGLTIGNLSAAECTTSVAKVISIQGSVDKRSATKSTQQNNWSIVKINNSLCSNDMLRVNKNSRAAILLTNDTLIRLNQNTTITLANLENEQSHWIDLQQGIAHFIARIKQSFTVVTPFVNAAVEGTEFVVQVNEDNSLVTVFEGKVVAKNNFGAVALTQGQTAITLKDQIPVKKINVAPRDAVQWSMYYPTIIELKIVDYKHLPKKTQDIITKSIADWKNGNIASAIEKMQITAIVKDNAKLLTYRAGLYLNVGQLTIAQDDINTALSIKPEYVPAIALKAIISIVQNKKSTGLSLAEQAYSINPNNISAVLALSYAIQSQFDINTALKVIKEFTARNQQSSDSVLIWSRLSELYLMTGKLNKALEAAKKANILNPNTASIHRTLGFAYLTRIKTTKAIETFKKAIELDDTDPLSRLGLGLVLIRTGKLALGRQQIEFATTLDPNNALIRSYLGKAYYEEKRNTLAATQYQMAKELDPNDPTAYFYNAIRKQSINKPIQALNELQQSIELNNNRAVYRSSLQLDKDDAARSVSSARIYTDLDFNQLALNEAYKAVNTDPSNGSAHRFLSDAYLNQPRQEISRVSELLQAQLFQPLNLNPIQPQIAEGNIGVLDGIGPVDSSFNEFNPMFTRNKTNLQFNGLIGGNNTKSDNLILSGLHDWFSYSLGQYYYESDGFRPNNDLKHEIYNVFLHARVTDKLNIQIELRDRKTESGDLKVKFDPDDYQDKKRYYLSNNSQRASLIYRLKENQTFVASYMQRDDSNTTIRATLYPENLLLQENII